MNVGQLLLDGAARNPDGLALKYGRETTSYPQLVDRVQRLADGLLSRGLKPGDRVVLDLPNRPEFVELMWACFWGGFVVVPLNWHLHPLEVAYIVENARASAILVADETLDSVHYLPDDVLVLDTCTSDSARATVTPLTALTTGLPMTGLGEPARVQPNDPAWLFYTSGTTGRPKGATLSHRNLMSMTRHYFSNVDPMPPRSVVMHAAPLSHGSGLYLLPALGHGATNVIHSARTFDADAFVDVIAQEKSTHIAFLAPTMLNRVVRAVAPADPRLATLRSIVVGGAPFYQEDATAAVQRLGPIITQIYGQGEAPMTVTVLSAAEFTPERAASCGRPFPGVSVRIIDRNGTSVHQGQVGEVAVQGDVVMSGYWEDPEATKTALKDGWLRTGDIGHFDAAGYLHLTDRAKDVIISGGSNIYPREVEEVLHHHEAVKEASVVGEPSPEWGESVVAFVVTHQGAAVTARELIEHCRKNLASFKKPSRIIFLDDLPKNAAGKILKRELRDLLAEAGAR